MNEDKSAEVSAEPVEEAPESKPANFNEKRVRFFAKREGAFLWLLAPPVLIVGALVFITIILWLARQVGVLETLATP